MQNWRGGLPSGKNKGRADGDGAELVGDAGPQMKLVGLVRPWLSLLG